MTKAKPSSRSAKRARDRPQPPGKHAPASRRRYRPVSGRPRGRRPLITTVIFDLDDTLYDCYGQRVLAAHRHAAEAMVRAGVTATVEEVFQARMKAYATDPQLSHIDAEVCRHFGVADPEAISRAARAAFFTTPVGRLSLFRGTRKLLRTLKQRGVKIFVVSFGDPQTQRDKVASLGLDREPSIDRIFYADIGHIITKEGLFRSILRNAEGNASRVLVVGDKPSSEIRAGKQLGMHTVRMRHGEFASLEPQDEDERADFEISKIDTLLTLPFQFGHM